MARKLRLLVNLDDHDYQLLNHWGVVNGKSNSQAARQMVLERLYHYLETEQYMQEYDAGLTDAERRGKLSGRRS